MFSSYKTMSEKVRSYSTKTSVLTWGIRNSKNKVQQLEILYYFSLHAVAQDTFPFLGLGSPSRALPHLPLTFHELS